MQTSASSIAGVQRDGNVEPRVTLNQLPYKSTCKVGFEACQETLYCNCNIESALHLVKYFVENKRIDINDMNEQGDSFLFWVCKYLDCEEVVDIVKELCEANADVNFVHPLDGSNCLFALIDSITAIRRQPSTVFSIAFLLIHHGINLKHTNDRGITILSHLYEEGDKIRNRDIIELDHVFTLLDLCSSDELNVNEATDYQNHNTYLDWVKLMPGCDGQLAALIRSHLIIFLIDKGMALNATTEENENVLTLLNQALDLM